MERQQYRRVLIMASASQGFDREVVRGVGNYANFVSGWLFRSFDSNDENHHCERAIRKWNPTGIISLARCWSPPLELARVSGIPIVQAKEIDEEWHSLRVPHIYTDESALAKMVADYFTGRGLRSIGFIGSGRLFAVRQDIKLRAEAEIRGLSYCAFHGETRSDIDPTNTFRVWLQQQPRRTGFLTSSDWFAWNAMSECVDSGYKVPDDFAFIGIGNDSPWSELAAVPLSSVCLAAEKIGYRAASLLDRMMRGDKVPLEAITIPPTDIIARRSTEIIAAEDPDVAAALRFISNHAAEGCTVKQVLRNIPIDRRRLERWCREKLGRSPREEIQRLRIANVKRLLAETDESAAEIARKAGFVSDTVLCRAFLRETGTTLVKYRRQFKLAALR